MTITPFLTLNLLGRKDILRVRQHARRVASLLSFDIFEQACIAAGAFVVACQALVLYGKAKICFQIENNQLCVFAKPEQADIGGKRLAAHFQDMDSKSIMRLAKPLPPQHDVPADEIELGWMAEKVERTACKGLFDEIIRQNQEILTLLHELRMCRREDAGKATNLTQPDAA